MQRKQTVAAPSRSAIAAPRPRFDSDRSRQLRTEELHARLRFSATNGRIWLEDQRMILLHLTAFASMRKELIQSVGLDKTREFFTRMGYSAGTQAARMATRIRPDDDMTDAFSTGPAYHAMQGLVSVETLELEIDTDAGTYYCEQLWHDSAEDDAHVAEFGIGHESMCWMQIGYASGYNSTFFGRPIMFREVECQSMGHPHCRIIGRLAHEWKDAQNMRFFQPQSFVNPGVLDQPAQHALPGLAADKADDLAQHGLVGVSSGFVAACHKLQQVAPTNASVLMLGETGVGKERFAQMLHQISKRRAGPFVAVNCGAIPESLLESELFGVERGAYTGAGESRKGRFERADGGTLFLDEIGTLNESGQSKLLRALQQREIERVGGSQPRSVDVRVVAATNADLEEMVRQGRFRADLFYRLNVFPITIPPLRKRRDDIPLLARHFLSKYAALHGRNTAGLSYRALSVLLNYDFPGNVRELENIIERGTILASDGDAIDVVHLGLDGKTRPRSESIYSVDENGRVCAAHDLDAAAAGARGLGAIESLAGQALDAALPLEAIEDGILNAAVQRSGGNLAASARLLGISRAQLEYRLKRQAEQDQKPRERRQRTRRER